ncbi:hypothetical protein PHSC3_001085 [Chlamydiales bacterium STE3]|nr:hypothetical protein PHSC3_001085 [Chlamydiales bacterium STE3]
MNGKFNKILIFYALLIHALFVPLKAENTDSPSPPNPSAINETVLTYFDTDDGTLNERLESFSQLLTKIEASGNKKFDSIIAKIRSGLKSLSATPTPNDIDSSVPREFAKSYRLTDLLNLHHAIRKSKLDLKSLYDAEKENKSQLSAASDNFDRELEFYRKLQPETAEKVESGLETLYYLILVKIGERKQKIIQRNIAVVQANLKNEEDELSYARNRIVVSDNELVSIRQDTKFLKNDWLETKNAHQAKEADLIIDNQDSTSDQEILKSSLKELSAKQKLIFSEMKLTLASLIHPNQNVDIAKVNQKIIYWQQQLRNLRQTTDNWLDKLQNSMQRYGEMLSLSVGSQGSSQAYSLAQENLLTMQTLQSHIDDSEFLIRLIKEHANVLQGRFSYYLSSLIAFFTKGLSYVKNALSTTIFHIGLTAVTYWGLLRFLAILVLTLYASRFLIRTLSNYALEKKKVQRSIVYRLSRLLHYLVLTLGLLLALSSIGFDFSNFLLIAGALGVGLGFGLQSIFNNFVSGIIMLFESQLKIGDFIEVAPGFKGEIREINVRSTLLTNPDGVEIIVPNADMISNKISNWTFRHTYRRLRIPFSVAYGTDPKIVQKVILETAIKMPDTLLKLGFDEPIVVLTKLAESGLEFDLVLWVSKIKATTQSDYLIAINEALRQNKLDQPFPQRDLHITHILGATRLDELKQVIDQKS